VPLRVFPDKSGKLSQALAETGGGILVISQFTLFGTLAKGARPSFHRAARPDHAIPLYERFLALTTEALGKPAAAGEFGADMAVDYVNDGPVTLWLDSKNRDY
jgi:D-tyrosyl-tRNA(Tyr) deacylase